MSVGVRKADATPKIMISRAMTMKVYGRRSASLTMPIMVVSNNVRKIQQRLALRPAIFCSRTSLLISTVANASAAAFSIKETIQGFGDSVIVPGAAGNTIDIIARLIGQWLSERLGQPFVIENRPGAGTNIGTEAVVRAPA